MSISGRNGDRSVYSPVLRGRLVCCTSHINITACVAAVVVAQRGRCTRRQTARRPIRWTQILRTRIQATIFVLSGWCTWRRCVALVCRRVFGQCAFGWCALTVFAICPITPIRMRIVCRIASTRRNIMTIFDSVHGNAKTNLNFKFIIDSRHKIYLCNLCQIEIFDRNDQNVVCEHILFNRALVRSAHFQCVGFSFRFIFQRFRSFSDSAVRRTSLVVDSCRCSLSN